MVSSGALDLFCLVLMSVLFLFAQIRNALPVKLLGSLKWRDVMTVLIGDPLMYAEDVSLRVVSATLNSDFYLGVPSCSDASFVFRFSAGHFSSYRVLSFVN